MFLKIVNLSLIINFSVVLFDKGSGICYSQTGTFVKIFNFVLQKDINKNICNFRFKGNLFYI